MGETDVISSAMDIVDDAPRAANEAWLARPQAE